MTQAETIQKGIGKGRNPWAIRAYLSTLKDAQGNSVNMSAVARMADTWPQVAQETVRGIRNHRRVLAVLEHLGCPHGLLYGSTKQSQKAA